MKHARFTHLLLASSMLSLAACGGGGGGGDSTSDDDGGTITPTGWTVTTIDQDTDSDQNFGVGLASSLALDANGKAHVSYYDSASDTVKYATNAGGTWVKVVVDSTVGDIADMEFERTSIALDGAGRPRIAYTSQDDSGTTLGNLIEYATNEGASWTTERIDLASHAQGDPSLAFDASSGFPAISYAASGGLYLSSYNGSGWSRALMDGADNPGHDNALVLAADGIHLVYGAGGFVPDELRYVTGVSAPALITTATLNVGYTSLAVDGNYKNHVSYSGDHALRYATDKSGSWVVTVIETLGVPAEDTSIGLDSAGHVHISYHDGDYLKYATNKSGSWVTSVVDDSTIEAGPYSSLEVDAAGKVHITYQALENGVNYLKYAVSP